MMIYSSTIRKIKYAGKTIEIKVINGCDIDGTEGTMLSCPAYCDTNIFLPNSTEQQVEQQINNIVKIAQEKIDSMPSFTQKVKKLFK